MAEDLPAWARDSPAGELPDWAKEPERGVLERAGSATAETFKAGLEHAGKALSPPRTVHKLPGSLAEAGEQLLDPETYKKGATEALTNLKDTGLGLLSPLTMTAGALSSGAASLLASGQAGAQRLAQSGIKKSAEALAPESRLAKKPIQSSEEAYEQSLPGAELALMALGPRVPKAGRIPAGVPKSPDFKESGIENLGAARPLRTKPGRGEEAEAGQIIEKLATDPAKVQRTLESAPAEIVAGSEPTTHQLTADYGLGQAERAAKTRDYAPFHQREALQNATRIKALQEAQAGGSAEDISTALRDIARANQQAADEAVRLAEQRAWETTRRMGGENDATTYGEVLRQELRNAEEATRAEETRLWQEVDPGGRLRANPQPLQELERGIYGVMPEGGAAEASLTDADKKISGVIQNYRNIIPFQELRDLRHLINTELREELINSGRSPAYARLSRLRQGVADMEGRAFDEVGALDAEASQRLRTASTATRERAEEFGLGPVGQVLQRGGSQGPFKVGESSVPERFIQSGAKGYDSASSFLRASPQSLDVFQDAVAASARREVINPDGTINPRRLEGWLKRYQDTLRAIDDRDGGAFSQGLRNLRTAQETLAAAQERQALVREQNERGMFGQLLGSVDEADITKRVGTLFGGVDRVQRARELRNMVAGNPAAEAGLRRSVIDHITERFLGTVEIGEGQTGLRASMFQKFVRENQSVLRQLMSPEQVETLNAIAADLQQATRQLGTKVKGSSNTAQDLFNAARTPGAFSELSGAVLHWAIGKKLGKPGRMVYDAVTGMIAKGRDQDFERIQKMIDRAMLEPDYARQLLSKTRVQRSSLGRGAKAGVPIGAAENAADDRPHTISASFQAGGGVPAIGGTGGRSPGARETARTGAARGGAGQALQDGGEAREQQAAAPVGGRERFAAALQGVPTGAGFGGGGSGQRAKPKPPTSMLREDIRRTLQSFGITGEEAGGFAERQLGERPVDSRAYGGGVDDPSGERSPIHYDPGDDTTFDARFGKWDKTATGKSLPRDDEDIDGTILIPGQKMIHGGGYEGERGAAGYYMTRGMADGGTIEDRWANLPSSRNIEDRRGEDPLSPGQVIAGNQAFMGKYPSPYTRAPRRAATAEARADGGEVGENPLRITVRPQLPDALIDQTQSYLADQIGGVEREHEKQDPLEAMIEDSGGRRKAHPSDGASDEGINPFEAAAARTRRRAPVREPDPASLAASQGKVGWGDVARDKLEKGIKTVTAPGRAYKEGMTDDEMIEASQGMAGLMGGARFPGVAAGVSEGSLGIFGGKGSKTADLDMMHRAMEMRAKGVRPESVWNQTGWFRGPEGLWRYEIPDYDMRLKPTETTRPLTRVISSGEEGMSRPSLRKSGELSDITEHPEFARAYPKLMRMPAEMEIGVRPGGGYMPPDWLMRHPDDVGHVRVEAPLSKEVFAADIAEAPSEITPRRILLHEMQHAVQAAEDFAPGGNPMALPYSQQQIAAMTKKRAEAEGLPWAAINVGQRQTMYNMMRQHLYERLAGEVEARNVERRRDITGYRPPPWKTQDVKRHNQLVFSDPALAYGFRPTKGQKPFKKPEPYADGGEVGENPPLPDAVMEGWGDPFERAARRQKEAVQPERGHRKEGLATKMIEGAVPYALAFPERFTKMSMGAAEGDPERATGREQFELLQYLTGMGPRAGPAGSVVMAGRRGPRAPPVVAPELRAGEVPAADRPVGRSHNLPPGEETLPVEAQPKSTAIGRMRALRELPYDEAMAAAKTERHLVPQEGGGYAGAPEWVRTPEDLARMRAHIDEQARKGLAGRTWYERGQEGVEEMAGPEPANQRLLSREKALFSPKAMPETNLGFALQAHNAYEAGKPLDKVYDTTKARFYNQARRAGTDIQLGKKTGVYARHLDRNEDTPAIPVNDIHHLENFQYENPEGGASAATHAFMDAETLLAADRANQIKLGGHEDWTPGRVQAAAWVEAKAQALMASHGWSYEKAMDDAIKAYIEHFPKYTAHATHEATPGIGTRHLPGIAQGSEAERGAFAADPRSFWRDPSGRDIMHRALGMWTRPTLKSTGVYDRPPTKDVPGGMEVNPAEVGRPMVSFSGPPGDRVVGPADRAMMDAAEAARAYVDVQNAGAWSIPITKQKSGPSTSAYAYRPGAGPLPIGDIGKLQAIGAPHKLPDVIDYGEGSVLTSFGDGPTGREVTSGLKGGLGEDIRGVLGGPAVQVKLDTGYIDYQKLWGKKKEGTGAVTRELQKYLTNPEAPAIIAKLDSSMELRRSVAAKLERDAEIAEQTGQPIRADVQLARKIIIEEGFGGLFRALKAGAALPALAFVPLLQLLAQGEEVNRGE